MLQVGLFDGSFTSQPSMGSGNKWSSAMPGEYLPKYFQWDREAYHRTNVYTDMKLERVIDAPKDTINIALLLEPPLNSDSHYNKALELSEFFDCILTYSLYHVSFNKKCKFYPFGMTYIGDRNWKMWPKSRLCSMIYSSKTRMEGHALRHEIAEKMIALPIDFFGEGTWRPMPYKEVGLCPYQYSIVVENCRFSNWFTEKIIDCFATHTIPIYWGCPDIDDYFNKDGIITFKDIIELPAILRRICSDLSFYEKTMSARMDNFNRAKKYRVPEDWIYIVYKDLFPEE